MQDDEHYYVVSDLKNGGTLLSKLATLNCYSESLIADIIYQIMLGLNYLHSNEIEHGDLNLNNIVFAETGTDNFDVQISNCGFGACSKSDNVMFMSPELVLREYCDTKTDVWSLGCMVYTLLSGKMCFENTNYKNIKSGILYNIIKFKEPEWTNISQ